MKRILSLALSVLLLATTCLAGLVLPTTAADTSGNLLAFGDFEGTASDAWTWATSSATNREKYAIISEEYGKAQITTDPDDPSNHCLIFEPSETGALYNGYYKSAPVVAGKKYRLSMRYKGSGLRVYLERSNCTPNGTFNPADATEWTDHSVVFTVNESMTNRNFIFNFGHVEGDGTAYLDDVCLTEVIDLTGVSLPEQITLSPEETQKLTLTLEPANADVVGKTITWTSSDPAIATVANDGTVTAVSGGVAYITASIGGFAATTAVVVESTSSKWTDTNLMVNGDLEAETLPTNWKKFVDATANVTHTTEPGNTDNHCLKITGSKLPNYQSLGAKKGARYVFSFRYKGTGKVAVAFTNSYATDSEVLESGTCNRSTTASDIRYYLIASDEWQTFKVAFTVTATTNQNWILQFGANGDSSVIYIDDCAVNELGVAHTYDGIANGTVKLTDGTTTGTKVTGLSEGSKVSVTVTPKDGYLLVPGSLRYSTPDGFVKRILNKNGEFGEGDGNTFEFDMPLENVRVFADFVKTDVTNFAFGTVGTSVRYADDGITKDGIRFLTRISTEAFDPTANGLTFKYEGAEYTVKEIGLMLKRSNNLNELTVENKEGYGMSHLPSTDRIWSVAVYTDANKTFRLTDYTDTYLDYTIAMTTSNPNDAFNVRKYTARGYLILEKDGVETVLYADERTDSVETALARENGKLSDSAVVTPGDNTGTVVPDPDDPSAPIPEDNLENADMKILAIGNSYSQDATTYLSQIAALEGKTFKTVNLYKSGCYLQSHYDNWYNNQAIYDYQLNGKAVGDGLVTLKATLLSDQFDVITLQESSWRSINYSNFQPYLDLLITEIRKLQPNATIYIHQVWAYGDGHAEHASRPGTTGGTMEAMFAKTEAAYNSAAAATGLSLIPSGQAVMNAQTELNKGGYSVASIQRDNSHVSYDWGRYMLGRLWYEMLTGETPDVTMNQVKSSVANDAAMEALVAEAIADAFDEYPADPVGTEANA